MAKIGRSLRDRSSNETQGQARSKSDKHADLLRALVYIGGNMDKRLDGFYFRVVRGGSGLGWKSSCNRAAKRDSAMDGFHAGRLGFRIVMGLRLNANQS